MPGTRQRRSGADAAVEHVTSADGTHIAYVKAGYGPPLVLVHGTAAAHWSFRFLVPLLIERFTVYTVDRRGRGESGDAAEYAIEREFADVVAVVDSIAEPASVFGHSFGATLALGAALDASNVERLALYEPAPGIRAVGPEDLERIDDLLARGRPDDALVHAFRSFGLTPEELEQLRSSPTWADRVVLAPTVSREVRAEEGYTLDAERAAALEVPILLLLGEESPAWAHEGTETIRSTLPDARVAILRGQAHAATVTAPELVAAELTRFLGRQRDPAG